MIRNLYFLWNNILKIKVGRNSSQAAVREDITRLFISGDIEKAGEIFSGLDYVEAETYLLDSKIRFFSGEHDKAEAAAVHAMMLTSSGDSCYKKAFYSRLEAMRAQGKFQQVRNALRMINFTDTSNQYFRALRLAVDCREKISFYEDNAVKSSPGTRGFERALFNYILLLRDFGRAKEAITLSIERFYSVVRSRAFGSVNATLTKKNWSNEAEVALKDLNACLQGKGINFFLISGTLLGCVREQSILGHDKDIDIGVTEIVKMDELHRAIADCPVFKEREIRSENCCYVQHANGVDIDIFRHYETGGRIWHEGIKTRWWNTPFELKQTEFLGQQYAIPADTDRYLTENYGDWSTPKLEYDTFLDTPNIESTSEDALTLYYLSVLVDHYLRGNMPLFKRIADECNRRVDDAKLKELCVFIHR